MNSLDIVFFLTQIIIVAQLSWEPLPLSRRILTLRLLPAHPDPSNMAFSQFALCFVNFCAFLVLFEYPLAV